MTRDGYIEVFVYNSFDHFMGRFINLNWWKSNTEIGVREINTLIEFN